ncbi:MAG: S41 family peptidase [Acidobacteriota bacterium]
MTRIVLVDVETRRATFVTSDRWRSSFPTFDPNGDWLYFLSDRHYESAVMSPWEDERHPAPHFPRQTKVYAVALRDGLRPPWLPADELHAEAPNADAESTTDDPGDVDHGADRDADAEPPATLVDREGLAERLVEVPVPPGEYRGLTATEHRLFWVTAGDDRFGPARIQSLRLAPTERGDEPDVDTVVHGVPFFVFEMSADRRHLLVRQQHRDRERLAVIEAPDDGPASTVGSETLAEQTVDLGDWTFPFDPREEWRQMFVDAWRLHRDYFWDGGMHGVDWLAMREKYTPLVDRVTDRAELSDLLAQMVSELSALHTAVRGGDRRDGPEDVRLAYLGADVERADAAGGYRITHIPRPDPERPELRSPVHAVGVDLVDGDVIVAIDGVPTLERPPGAALRQKAGRMVRLRVDRDGTPRDVLVEPISARRAAGLRLSAWEYERRQRVEAASDGRIGYVHLRAMGTRDIAQWAREFYPVHHLDGLIVDVRHNRGGNIDSWILGDLLRRPWSWWKQRVGPSDRNMQGAFGGHMVVLVDAWTASDGELFAEGFRRLGLGPVIGTRTWGGQIWLTASNHLVDRGIATAAETGVFGPEGEWLIEGHGVDPDHVVDNLPHATFHGGDAQLDAAISTLLDAIEREPPTTPSPPSYPDRSSPDNRPVETRHD